MGFNKQTPLLVCPKTAPMINQALCNEDLYGGGMEFLTSRLHGNQQLDSHPDRFIPSEANKKFPLQMRLRGC
jgi:hypothetical protein